MLKLLRTDYMKKRLVAIITAGVISFVALSVPPQQVSSAGISNNDDSQRIMESPIVVSTMVPNTTITTAESIAVSMKEEINAEVRFQETLEKEITEEIEQQTRMQELKEERINYINSIVCDPTNVSRVSGLKESDFKFLTEGTWWEGNEAALVELEREYGINAMFAMSVSTLESGFGTSTRAQSRNNYYGLELTHRWNSLHDNTKYWGELISTKYVDEGRESVRSIASKYCPPNSEFWTSYNETQMKELYNLLITRLNNTVL